FASATTDPGSARRITSTAAEEMGLAWAPDNRRLVYSSARDGELNLYLFDVGSGVEKRLTTSDRPDYGAQFSPDGKSTAFLGNANASTISWTPDGRSLYFATSQRSEPGSVARVDLVPRVPKFREQQFRELFKEETPKSVPSPADKENRDDKKTDAAPEKAT